MGRHKQRSIKSGMPPGSLVHVGERKLDRAAVSVIEYGPDELREHATLDALDSASLPVRWINVHGLHEPELLAEVGRRFDLHPLVLEDILNTDQRPKVDDYGDYLYVVVRFFDYDAQAMSSSSEQVSLVVGDGFVLTFQERPTGSFTPVRERLRQDRGRVRQLGADYLAHALLDVMVDRYFAVLEQIGEHTDRVEDELMQRATPAVLQTLHQLKRETLALRRAVWPLREVVNTLTRDTRFFTPGTQPYLRDVYDHTVHVLESLEAIRDVLAGMLDIYLSSVSNRVNQEVRVLTVIALIFMPATLISGIFGMNFRSMPLLEEPAGFAVALGMMATVATTIAIIFWRRRWLD